MHVYSNVNAIMFSGAYFQRSAYRIAALVVMKVIVVGMICKRSECRQTEIHLM